MYGLENWTVPNHVGVAVVLCAARFGTSPAYPESGRWYTQAQVERGAEVFVQHCAECHGANAEATPNWRQQTPDGKYPPPPLNGTAHAWHHPLDVLRRQIRLGGVPLGGSMPAFEDKLSAADINAAIAYFQSKWDDEIYALWRERDGGGDALVRSSQAAAENRATRRLRQHFPDLEIGVPEATPVENIVLIKARGQYIYLTADGRHAFVGSLLDLESGTNLTESGRGRDRLAALAAFPDADRVIFPAQGEERARLTVFTDPSCGYCRKLHREVPRLQREGVTVSYVPFPRSGPSGPAYETMRRVWCSPDRASAMDIAKGVADGALAGGDCGEADVVGTGYDLGLEVGVSGTPAIVLPDGRLQPGYRPADRLLGDLGLDARQASLPKTR